MSRQTPQEALEAAKFAVRAERIKIKASVADTLSDLGLNAEDVERAILSAVGASPADYPDCWWLLGGRALDGEDLEVAIDVRDSVIFVTRVKEKGKP